jgi:hypothetical protein
MQAQAVESRRRFAMARPFQLRGRAVARRAKVASGYARLRRTIPLLFGKKNLKTGCFESLI